MKRLNWSAAILLGAAVAACGADDEGAGDATPTEDTGTGNADSDAAVADVGVTDDDTAVGDDVGEADPYPGCEYPAGEGWGYGEVIPEMSWAPAYLLGEEFEFGLRDFYCSPEYDAYDTMLVLISAEWCPNCPQLIEYIDVLSPRLEEEGMLLLFVEAQDNNGQPADSALALSNFSRYARYYDSGIRVGESNATPFNALGSAPTLEAFPTTVIVRRSDMRNIADSSRSRYYLPFVEVAMDPESDWGTPPAPTIFPEYPPNCGPDTEESFEPNDTADQAASVGVTTVEGGVCNAEPDFYQVTIEGPWTAELTVDDRGIDRADLDIMVWDAAADRAVRGEDGAKIGSEGGNHVETFDHEGPALVRVYGFSEGTANYSLTFSAR